MKNKQYENIPSELKQLPNWVCWNDKKQPINARTGGKAMPNNPTTWSDFNTAVQAVDTYNLSGVGFVIMPPYIGIDLDTVRNSDTGEICADAQYILDTVTSYTEISQSGAGLHIICRGDFRNKNKRKPLPCDTIIERKNHKGELKKNEIEMYHEKHYFALTGDVYNSGTAVIEQTENVKTVYDRYMADDVKKPTLQSSAPTLSLTESDIVMIAMKDDVFRTLWHGDISSYQSHSEADLALCNKLAFYCGKDIDMMDKLFRQSSLYRSEKWEREDYRSATLNEAVAGTDAVYDPNYRKVITAQEAFSGIVQAEDNDEWYRTLTSEQIISRDIFERLYAITDKFEREQAEAQLELRASELKIVSHFKKLYKTFRMEKAKSSQFQQGNVTDFPDQPIQLSCGKWVADASGVYRQKIGNLDNIYNEYASVIPIMPTEILENVNTGIEKIKLDFYKSGMGWRSLICDRVTTAHNAKIIDLANSGIEVNSENAKLLVQYIADCVALNSDVLPRSKSVSQMGWLDGEFMPYADDIRFDGERENKHLFDAICEKGNYDIWHKCVSDMRSNIYLRMTMAASFASPLIELVSGLPFVFNLWGGTGTGKTVGLMTAMSIWGNPSLGKLTRSMNSTDNSTMATAAFLQNLPYAGDELQTIKSIWGNYDKLIMRVCEGIERGRMSYDRNNETRSWKCAFIFTGEEPCTQSSSGGGAKNRVIEVECTSPVIDISKGQEIVSLITTNFGHAGKIYINHVKQNQDRIVPMYTMYFNFLMESVDTTEKQAQAMALMLTGDSLARECIFTHEVTFILSDIKKFMMSKAEVNTSERAYQFVVNLIAQHETKFDTLRAADVRGEMWGKSFYADNYVMFNKDILVKQMRAEGFEFDAVKAEWAKNGYLILTNQNRYYHNTKCHDVKAYYLRIVLPKEEDSIRPDN